MLELPVFGCECRDSMPLGSECRNLSLLGTSVEICPYWVRVSGFVADSFLMGRNRKVLPPSRPAASKCPPDTCIWIFESQHQKRKKLKQLMLFQLFWSECRDSNSRPLEPHSSAIPNFATPGFFICFVPLTGDFDILPQSTKIVKHFFSIFQRIFRGPESPRFRPFY